MITQSNNTDLVKQGGSTDAARKAFLLMLRNWYFFLITLIIASGCSYVYITYKFPIYRTQTSVLIEENATPGQDMLEGFSVRPGVQNLDNQIVVLSSYTTIRKAVEELPFEVDIYRKGLFSVASYYPMDPIKVQLSSGSAPLNLEFLFQYIGGESFRLSCTSKAFIELDTILDFGEEFFTGGGSFTIFPQLENARAYQTGDNIYFQFYDKAQVAEAYKNRLLTVNATRDGSVVQLTLEGTNKVKDMIFLDKLTEVFMQDNLDEKNLEAKRIIDFIEAQLVDVEDDLEITETQLQEFRSRNRIMDVSAQTQQIIDQAVILENEKARLSLENSYYVYLEEYLSDEDNDNRPIAPASMGIEDALLASSLQELSGLQAEYYGSGVGDRNPMQGQLEMRIRNVKRSVKEVLSGIMQANQMAIAENQKQINTLNLRASQLPEKEQQLLGFQRKFNLNNVLYTHLLTRRAEAQIQKASNAPDHHLVDPARSFGPIAPVLMNVLAIAFSIAIIIPSLILLLINNILKLKVQSEEDLALISNLPIIGEFPHSRLSYYTIVLTDPSSIVSEAFRGLRTRLEFFTKEVECPLIVVSSSIPGEGKTFAAINLASVYSLLGVKTLLVGYDLRRPVISKNFERIGELGMTDYLIGRSKLQDTIYESGYDNLHILPAGSIPPNPGELSTSEKAKEAFGLLRKDYGCIIIDSAPVGVVSDIYPIAAIADVVLLVVRHGYTKKHALRGTLSDLETYQINGLGLLVNDVKTISSSYKYDYKYKYNYKPDTSKKKKRRLKREAKIAESA